MKKYLVRGCYTISFEMEIEADSIEEAEEMGYNLSIETEWNGKSVFTTDGATLPADGEIFDVEAERIDGDDDEDEDE